MRHKAFTVHVTQDGRSPDPYPELPRGLARHLPELQLFNIYLGTMTQASGSSSAGALGVHADRCSDRFSGFIDSLLTLLSRAPTYLLRPPYALRIWASFTVPLRDGQERGFR